jgi:iron complex transport system ATP-binding protein
MKSKLSLRNATFSYGKREIFSDLKLEVSQGDIFCLLGPNGCGKTTLLRCLNGALRLKKGSVWLDDGDISSLGIREIACLVGFVFQEHSVSLPYSVLELVLMGRAPHLGMFSTPSKKDTEIAEQALELVGISHLKDKRCTQISGGEKQLALIARTLAQETEVILLDEPTSHLDFKNQALVLRMIKKLAEQGLTIIMSSHFPNHAFLCSSRVAMMGGGRLIAVGNPEEAITEGNLRETYGIDEVKIYSVKDPESGNVIKFCVPSK